MVSTLKFCTSPGKAVLPTDVNSISFGLSLNLFIVFIENTLITNLPLVILSISKSVAFTC